MVEDLEPPLDYDAGPLVMVELNVPALSIFDEVFSNFNNILVSWIR